PLYQGGLYLVDLGDLAADMEMEQLHVIDQTVLFEQVDRGDDLRHPQTEFRVFTSGRRPLSGPLGGELYPYAKLWLNPGLLDQLDDLLQLEQLLDHQGYVVSDLGGIQNGLDVLGILVAVQIIGRLLPLEMAMPATSSGLEPTSSPIL